MTTESASDEGMSPERTSIATGSSLLASGILLSISDFVDRGPLDIVIATIAIVMNAPTNQMRLETRCMALRLRRKYPRIRIIRIFNLIHIDYTLTRHSADGNCNHRILVVPCGSSKTIDLI